MEIAIAIVTLTVLEIILGIDNIIFISVLSSRLPEEQQPKARQIGLLLSVVTRLALLASISWLTSFTEPLFTVLEHDISVRDLILICGGLFLLAKSTSEIHAEIEHKGHGEHGTAAVSFGGVITQILLLDVVFSLDSVITAIGMADQLWVMCVAVIIAIGFMLSCAGPVSDFVNRHPTVKVLALSFLLLIGIALVGEGLELHMNKGYLYFAMGFSFFIELLNMKLRKKQSTETGTAEAGTSPAS